MDGGCQRLQAQPRFHGKRELIDQIAGMGRDDDASVARMYARVSGTHLPGEPK